MSPKLKEVLFYSAAAIVLGGAVYWLYTTIEANKQTADNSTALATTDPLAQMMDALGASGLNTSGGTAPVDSSFDITQALAGGSDTGTAPTSTPLVGPTGPSVGTPTNQIIVPPTDTGGGGAGINPVSLVGDMTPTSPATPPASTQTPTAAPAPTISPAAPSPPATAPAISPSSIPQSVVQLEDLIAGGMIPDVGVIPATLPPPTGVHIPPGSNGIFANYATATPANAPATATPPAPNKAEIDAIVKREIEGGAGPLGSGFGELPVSAQHNVQPL